MTNYTLWADRGTGAEKIYEVAKYLKQCANGSVNVLGIGPSVGQNYGLRSGKGTVAVYMTNGVGIATPNDLEMGCKPGGYYKYDRAIFVWPQFIGNQYMSDENIIKHIVPGEWDWNRASSYNVGGQTAAKWFSQAKYVDLVAGKSPQDIAQRICNNAYVTESGNPASSTSTYGNNGAASSYDGQLQGNSADNISPLLQGEMTFQELVGEICNGIDILFLCKRSTVVVTDFSTIYAEAQYLREKHNSAVSDEDIKVWQLEEDSYELNINQHGYYNTVYVVYKNGIVKESYDDFVKVFGEMPITYKDKTVDKTTAQMKAKAYLAAHLRDLEMSVEATILSEPNIDIGDLVTLDNPHTKHNEKKNQNGLPSEYLFVKGINTSWDGESYIQTDLELQFSPTSPKKKEVPTTGNCITGQKGDGTDNNNDNSSMATSRTFNSCGVSSDGETLCAIGKPSAVGESHYGYTLYRSLFKRKCPFCGSKELYWGYMWSGNFPCTRKHNNGEDGKYEGHIYCDGCDADFSCIDGKDHMNPPRATLTRLDNGPVKSSEEEANKLKRGMLSL